MPMEKLLIILVWTSLATVQANAGGTAIDVNKPIVQKIDSYANILVNGDFKNPSIKNQFEILKELPGWQIDIIEKGKGSFYNPNWGPNQVIHLDVFENRFIRQNVRLSIGIHVIKMKYAAKVGFVSSSALSVFWNYKKVKEIYAVDENIKDFQLPLDVSQVYNVLQIRGQGISDGHGMTISDLRLESPNLIKNGDFRIPSINVNWVYLKDLPDWEVTLTQKARGSAFNFRWKDQEIIELDSDKNTFIRQRLSLKKGNYVFQLNYAPKVNLAHTSGMSVHWNGKQYKHIMAKDDEIYTLQLMLQGVEGQNVIELRGQAASDYHGMCIASVRLLHQEIFDKYSKMIKQVNEPQNFIRNGDFREVNLKSDMQIVTILSGWETKSIEIGKGQIYNFRWDSTRILKLDDKTNSFIRQKIILIKGPYLFRMKYAIDAGHSDLASILIFWNGRKVNEIISANDEEIHILEVKMYASEGQNTLQIRGEGASDRRGFSIADLMLLSDLPSAYILSSDDNIVTTSTSRIEGNLLKNGNFSQPQIKKSDQLIKILPQWQIGQASQAEKGMGIRYNFRWGNIQVLELDANKNYAISQKIQLKNGKYTFRMLYSGKSGRVQTSGMSIHWNGKKIAEIIAADQFIHEYQAVFDAVDGNNLLMIRGQSTSDSHGMTIANLRLTKGQIKQNINNLAIRKNLINNPNFVLPPVVGAQWLYFYDLASWAPTYKIQKGNGRVFNFRWGGLQVLQLDSDREYGIKQSFSLKKQLYMFRLRYAAKVGVQTISAMSIRWNNLKIKQVYPTDEELHQLTLIIQAQEGENILEIRGEGKSDYYGMSICNLQLYSLLRPSEIPDSVENINYLKNPSFLEPPIKAEFQYIKGLQGWEISLAQKGKGVNYNPKWGKNVYVLQLDVESNNFIRQRVELNKGIYLFKMKHAALLNGKDTSAMQILWNDKKVKEVIADDENIHNLELGLEAVEGSNVIQIRGSGKSDKRGMTISNLQLLSANFLRNGNFAQPPITGEWEYITALPYWQVKVGQKGKGSFYNYRWNKTQVLELDADQDYAILQGVQLRKGSYVFRFNYAAKINYVATSGLSVFWNGIKIDQIFPNDQQVHQISLHIQAIQGENILQVKGEGPSDHYGITISNLQLFKLFENYNDNLSFSDTDTNLIKNPHFFEPQIKSQKQVLQKLTGWETTLIQRGIGLLYNPKWGRKEVVKLDVNSNANIKQKIQLRKGFYKFGMEYVAKSLSLGFSLHWNSKKVLQILGNNQEIHQFEVDLIGIDGQNILQIRSQGSGDSNGLTITSLRLHPSQNAIASPLPQEIINSNVLKNRKFQLPALAKDKDLLYFDSIPDWQTTRIKKSKGISYSSKWGGNLEVIQLLGKSKDNIQQRMALKKGIYIFGIKYGARKDCIGACGITLNWNGNKVLEIFGNDEEIHEFEMSLSSIEGQNVLQIRGQGKLDTYGLAIADLRLNRLDQCPSYINF